MSSGFVCQQKLFGFLIVGLLLSSCAEYPESKVNNDPDKYNLVKDVLWASPDGFDLTMDIYTPTSDEETYPIVVMFHGGGWLINDKSIMDQAAAYLATNSNYVVCNVNYRLLSDNDNSVKLNEIVNDAFGAVLWIKDNIAEYKGDSTRIAVTGDSAGAHLSAMIVNMGDRLSSEDFSLKSLRFTPSYLPEAKSAENVAEKNGLAVQAAVLNYGVYDLNQAAVSGFESMMNPFWIASGTFWRGVFGEAFNVVEHPSLYQALSPTHNIPHASDRSLPPQLLTVGSEDPVVTPASVKSYTGLLQSAGHPARYWEYQSRSHAFLDSGSNAILGSSFEADAPKALNVMIEFLDEIFYP
jgi:acetyl esterase/lipase